MRVIVLILVVLLTACQSLAEQRHSSILFVPSDATDIKWSDEYSGAVHYVMQQEFPAADLLKQIESQMKRQGLSPVRRDLFNPTQDNSHSRGWANFVDRDDSTVFLWIGDWKADSGDQVRYELRYRVRKGDKTARTRLDVYAMHIDAASVMRLQADQQRPAAR
jgi:hypothetical protein